jgi:membrane complex biogenesis BtpA family protein
MSKVIQLLLDRRFPVIAMVQLNSLPGSSAYSGQPMSEMIEDALSEATILAEGGVDAIMVQNLRDFPVGHRATAAQVASMARIAAEIRRAVDLPLGLNFLENDVEAMLAVCQATDLDFIRVKVFIGAMVTPSGVVEGAAHEVMRLKNTLRLEDVGVLADVHDRTGIPLGGRELAPDLHDAVELGRPDGLVLTGGSFKESLEFLALAKQMYPEMPRVLGGSSTVQNLKETFEVADGVIVSTALKDSKNAFGRFNRTKVREYMDAVRDLRK